MMISIRLGAGSTARLGARLAAILAALAIAFHSSHARAAGDDALSALVKPGHFAIMRHALAPGYSDPANFRIDDCATQRNLSEAGRRQSRRTGDMFRAAGISEAKVYSSRWCRCLETARLLGFGDGTPLESLNSFFEEREKGPAQIARLRADIAEMDLSQPVILVTHQVVVSGLAGRSTSSGEIIVMRRTQAGKVELVGAIAPRATQ
jgi:broad specificity phosphatase PhoE